MAGLGVSPSVIRVGQAGFNLVCGQRLGWRWIQDGIDAGCRTPVDDTGYRFLRRASAFWRFSATRKAVMRAIRSRGKG